MIFYVIRDNYIFKITFYVSQSSDMYLFHLQIVIRMKEYIFHIVSSVI